MCVCVCLHISLSTPLPPSAQVRENARRDLKEGLVLYNTDNNAGLRDAWNTIQGEVSDTYS